MLFLQEEALQVNWDPDCCLFVVVVVGGGVRGRLAIAFCLRLWDVPDTAFGDVSTMFEKHKHVSREFLTSLKAIFILFVIADFCTFRF